jgi:hypothetical protein
MTHENAGRRRGEREDAHLVEHFEPQPGTFRIGVKSLNVRSVLAAHGKPQQVLAVAARHLMREIPSEKNAASGRILPHLSFKNYVLVGASDAAGIVAYANQLMSEAGVKLPVRKDCVMGIELVFSLPATTSVDIEAYFQAALAWAREEFSPAPVISAVVHLDEQHPHMHVLVLPLIGTAMQGGKVLGFKTALRRRLRDFHLGVAKQFGLAEPIAKPSLSKAEREIYARALVDYLAACLPAQNDNMAVSKELLKLIVRAPYSLGRALDIPLPSRSHGTVAAGPAIDVSVSAGLPDKACMEGGTDQPAASTSCLCYDVAPAWMINGERSAPEHHPSQLPILVPNYDEKPYPDRGHEDGTTFDVFQPPVLVRDRDDAHLACTWDSALGYHVELPPPRQSNQAMADAAVALALEHQQARRSINSNKEEQ